MDYSLTEAELDWFVATVPCRVGCPAYTDIPSYIEEIREGRPADAYRINKRYNVMPLILGRICAHPCETVCRRGRIDGPVAICALKRYAADHTDLEALPVERAPATGKRVAVVGAGPSGLTAGYDLAILGHEVDVLEASPVVGGMLHLGIPSYRMPRDLLEKEIGLLRRAGVNILLDTAVGESVSFAELRRTYHAVFLGTGTHRGMQPDIPGWESLGGVIDAVEFLRDVNLGRRMLAGSRVVVIGGGNSAIDTARVAVRLAAEDSDISEDVEVHAADAARSALRLGIKAVTILYRRTREEMPAASWEVAEAEHEGVDIRYLAAPVRLHGKDGRVGGIECIRMELLDERDSSGRRRVAPVAGSEFTIPCDVVVAAISQQPDLSFLGEAHGISLSEKGLVEVAPETCETTTPGVFAGGDVVSGPRIAITGIADGHRAARAMDRYLRTGRSDVPEESPTTRTRAVPDDLNDFDTLKISRQTVPTREVETRVRGFEEVELGYDEEQAVAEASRCLGCHDNIQVDADRCILCGGCADVCPNGCIEMISGSRVEGLGVSPPVTTLLVLDEDVCIRCGSCIRRCPTQAIFMRRIQIGGPIDDPRGRA